MRSVRFNVAFGVALALAMVVFTQVLPITRHPWSWATTGLVAAGTGGGLVLLFSCLEWWSARRLRLERTAPDWSPAASVRRVERGLRWAVFSGVMSVIVGISWLASVAHGGRTAAGAAVFGTGMVLLGVARVVEARQRRRRLRRDVSAPFSGGTKAP